MLEVAAGPAVLRQRRRRDEQMVDPHRERALLLVHPTAGVEVAEPSCGRRPDARAAHIPACQRARKVAASVGVRDDPRVESRRC